MAATQVHQQALRSFQDDAAAAQSRGDFRAAADSYRNEIELEHLIPEQWANLGLMEYQIEKSAGSIQCFKQAIRLKLSLFVPQLSLSIVHLEAGNSAAGLPYRECAEMHP